MTTGRRAIWAELVQLIPVISLALPFIVQGTVDLRKAGVGFAVAAVLSVLVTLVVALRGYLVNPILIGAACWLWVGAIGFVVPVAPLRVLIAETQAAGLFLGALVAGAVSLYVSPYGYVACRTRDRQWVRDSSWWLLVATALALVWSWWFRSDIRLGGGLPFIALNAGRRLLCRFAPPDG